MTILPNVPLRCRITAVAYPLLVFLCVSLITGCWSHESGWRGSIEEQDGVILVDNPKLPLYPQDAVSLTVELTLGGTDERLEYIFSNIVIEVDDAGSIFVLDSETRNIRVFSPEGKYLRTIGRPGQGPGELQRPRYLHITPRQKVLVYDLRSRRVSFFTLEGSFLRQVPAGGHGLLLNLIEDLQGHYYGQASTIETIGIHRLDHELSSLGVIAQKERRTASSDRVAEYRLMTTGFLFALGPENDLIWGTGDTYELNITDAAGNLKKSISRDHDPVPFSGITRTKYIDLFTNGRGLRPGVPVIAPDHCPAIFGLAVDETGRILTGTFESPDPQQDYYFFDVFDPEGRYLARFPVELSDFRIPVVWKRGRLYAISKDREGYPVIKRYRVTWSD